MQLHSIETGSGSLLVIVHGLLGSARNWAGVAKSLGVHHRVVALDLPNHGASPWCERAGYDFLATEMAEAISHLGAPAAVIGHSMGGKAAMVLALTRPQLVSRLVVVDIAPVAYTHTFAPYIRAMRAARLTGVGRRGEVDAQLAEHIPDPRVRAFLLQNLDSGEAGYRWRANLAVLGASMEEILGFPDLPEGCRYEGPALFLAGAESDYVLPEHKPIIDRLFPHARIERIASAGHWIHADQPQAFTAIIEGFFGGVKKVAVRQKGGEGGGRPGKVVLEREADPRGGQHLRRRLPRLRGNVNRF